MGISSSKDGDESSLNDNTIPNYRGGNATQSQRSTKSSDVSNNHNQQKGKEKTDETRAIPMDDGSSSMGDNATAMYTEEDSDNIVPTVFKWDHGGRNVYITGTFNNWERQIPMHRSGNDFSYVHNLKRGKHAFKFIVDDEWRFAPDQPTVADIEGRINNFIDVTEFSPYVGDDNFFQKSKERKIPDEEYRQVIPDLDDYTKEPPGLPPHLRHIILNKSSPTMDPLALPNPQTVSLNHLYCTAIKDGMMVLGGTHRYREKYFTVVFYSIMPISTLH